MPIHCSTMKKFNVRHKVKHSRSGGFVKGNIKAAILGIFNSMHVKLSTDLPKVLLLIQVAQRICFRDHTTCFQG